ncbi:aldolase [Leucogyrophana mollusca]|uniref:Aldolase n=1 Tax=Leucogyrophana mollusca TaxID=85980 RepID=A0ACB8BUD9_9AGAM|nr:aldolase [Leucogyrophana mollusca]
MSSVVRALRTALPRQPRLCLLSQRQRYYATSHSEPITIVEVGPRDGLQNEKGVIPVSVKAELINRLAQTGLRNIEAGSFVSPKWVPQMAGTAEVISIIQRLPNVQYSVLVPNSKGLDGLLALLPTHSPDSSAPPPPPISEVAIFTAATDAFALANTNTTVAASLERLAPVASAATANGLRVRGYVSVAVTCPYSGKVDPVRVREVTSELVNIGCYEVSLGDTVGTGTPATVGEMIEEVKKSVPVEKLAGHFHDTYGTGVANVLASLRHGIRTIDASVGGLGGCPYSPGATGNVATEDVLYALQGSEYDVRHIDLGKVAEVGWWISEVLGRQNTSRAGRALWARRVREQETMEKEKARL